MKVKMCKALSLFLALVLAFTLIPARELAAATNEDTSTNVVQTEEESSEENSKAVKTEKPSEDKKEEPGEGVPEEKNDDPAAKQQDDDKSVQSDDEKPEENPEYIAETTSATPDDNKKAPDSTNANQNRGTGDEKAFISQPNGGTVEPHSSLRLYWETNFNPWRIEIGYFDGGKFKSVQEVIKKESYSGTYYQVQLDKVYYADLTYSDAVTSDKWILRAYFNSSADSDFVDSAEFSITKGALKFISTPVGGTVEPQSSLRLYWETNFKPWRVEIGYFDGGKFKSVQEVIKKESYSGTYYQVQLDKVYYADLTYSDAVTSDKWILRAYLSSEANSAFVDSTKFTITKGALEFVTQPKGGTVKPQSSLDINWETNFEPWRVEVGYFDGDQFKVVKDVTKTEYSTYIGEYQVQIDKKYSTYITYTDAVTSNKWILRAYLSSEANSAFVDSTKFTITKEALKFVTQPKGGTVEPQSSLKIEWETNFNPWRVEIGYFDSGEFKSVQEVIKNGTYYQVQLDKVYYADLTYSDAVTSDKWILRAYLNSDADSDFADSSKFTITKEALKFVTQPKGGTVEPDSSLNISWKTNFKPYYVEIGYYEGDTFISVNGKTYPYTPVNSDTIDIPYSKAVTSDKWVVKAYHNSGSSDCAESAKFSITRGALKFLTQPKGGTVEPNTSLNISWGTNFKPYLVELGYYDGDEFIYYYGKVISNDVNSDSFDLPYKLAVTSDKWVIKAYRTTSIDSDVIESKPFTIIKAVYSGKCGDNLNWSYEDGVLTIDGTGAMYDYDNTVAGSAPWNWLADKITTIELSSEITSVGNYAFADLLKLNSVTIPGGVTTIGSYSFKGCKALKSIVIPDSVRMLGEYAFFKAGLQSVTISSGLQIIPNAAFAENDLRNVTVPHGVIEIQSNAFASNPNLWKVDFPKTLRGIGDGAFSNCRLNEIVFPEGLNTIGERAFSNNRTVWGIKFIDGITSIGAEAFADCTALSRLDFLGAAPKFGADAFKNVEAKSYYIAGMYGWNTSVMQQYGGKITWVAIQKCGDSLYWDLDSDGVLTISGSGGMFQFLSGDKPGWYNDRNKIKSIIIMPDVTSIGSHAFDDCTNVKTIVFYGSKPKFWMTPFTNVVAEAYYILDETWTDLPNYSDASITWIPSNGQCGDNIFWTVDANKVLHLRGSGEMDNYTSDMFVPWSKWVPEIKAVEISEGITSIGNSAFYGCTNLEYANLPSTIKTIGEKAFYRCSRLQRVELPYGLTSIGNDAFNGCLILSEISIPNTVKTIGEYAFFGCSSLTGVKIPDSVTKMGQTAFSQCSSLSWVELGSGLKTIPSSAFSMCKSLDYIEIPDNVTTIASWAFMGCSLNNLKIQKTIESIGMGAFNSCSLGRAYFYGTPEEWNAVTKDPMNSPLNNVRCVRAEGYCNAEGGYDDVKWMLFWDNELYIEGIGNMASYSNGNDTKAPWLRINAGNDITKVVISEGVTNVGKYAFLNCKNLSSVELPDTITKIEEYAFYNCSSITELIIPESVKEIEGYAFYKCSSLQSINIPANIKELSMGVFASCSALENVDIPYGVTTIKASAFGACTSFTQIVIPSSVTRIESNVFYGCTNLEKIDLGDSVEFIGASAFSNCTKLSAITIPASVSVMQTYAFRNCTSLKTIIFEGNSQPQDSYSKPFYGVTSYAYYPANNPTWTESVRQNYGGTIKWVAVGENDVIVKFSHSCSFSSDLSVNYYIPFDEVSDYDNFRLVVKKQVFNGSTYTWMETTLTEHTTSVQNGVKYLRFEYKGVAAKEMGDELNATLYMDRYGMTFNTTVDNYSVKEYAYNRLKYSDDSIFKTLLVDMLNYGAASQTYFKYNTSHLVNADLTSDQSQYASEMPELKSVEDYMPIFTGDEPTAYFYGKSVSMSNSIELKYYMKFDSGAPADSVVLHVEYRSISGTTVSKDFHASEFVYDAKNDAYTVTLSDIAAKDMSCIIDAAIYDGEYSKDNDDNRISEIFSYSIETYVYNRLEKSNDEVFKDLVRAMIKYGKSAEKYFKNKK